ncbi:MAG: hypothetical protein AAFR46_13420, partial [Pseudomonadota bacterium]
MAIKSPQGNNPKVWCVLCLISLTITGSILGAIFRSTEKIASDGLNETNMHLLKTFTIEAAFSISTAPICLSLFLIYLQ